MPPSPSRQLSPNDDDDSPLTKAVNLYIKKINKHNPPPNNKKPSIGLLTSRQYHLLSHANHILQTLTTKRISLSHAIDVFKTVSSSYYNNHHPDDDANSLTTRLQQWFCHYLRLRDGLVLLTSGECRHVGDKTCSKRSKYKSFLKGGGVRRDGYTRLFSADCYSGYGWDEFFEDKVGVRYRLLHELTPGGKSKERVWDKLMERYGGSGFEMTLDEHLAKVKSLEGELERVRLSFIKGLLEGTTATTSTSMKRRSMSRRGGGCCGVTKVKMSVEDKFERLVVMTAGEGEIMVERQGNKFQIMDEGGVLPDGMGKDKWAEIMQLKIPMKKSPLRSDGSNKKRRVVICDDSDDDDDDDGDNNDVRNDVGTGLKIKVKMKEKSESSSSLKAIKEKLGVDQKALQQSREILEAEQQQEYQQDTTSQSVKNSSKSVSQDDDDISELREQIEEKKEELKQWKKIYNSVLASSSSDDDDDEIWDARECLRECSMQYGILLLSLNSLSPSLPLLSQAENIFENALSLIDAMQQQQTMRPVKNNESNNSRIQSTLLLLKGRASINLGKTLVEQCEINNGSSGSSNNEKTNLLRRAIATLTNATKAAAAMRAHALLVNAPSSLSHDNSGSSAVTSLVEQMEANELETISYRWRAMALNELAKGRGVSATTASTTTEEMLALLVKGAKLLPFVENNLNNESSSSSLYPVNDTVNRVRNNRVISATKKYLHERFVSAMYLSEVATTLVEKILISSPYSPITTDEGDGKKELILARRGYQTAAHISHEMSRLSSSSLQHQQQQQPEQQTQDNDVCSVTEIRKLEQELLLWWHKARQQSQQQRAAGSGGTLVQPNKTTNNSSATVGRGDLQNVGIPTTRILMAPPPNTRMVMPPPARPMTKKRTGMGTSLSGATQQSSLPPPRRQARQPTEFRKWGDELLLEKMQQQTPNSGVGREGHGSVSTTTFPYPACCPVMPQEMKRDIMMARAATITMRETLA